MAYYWDKQYNVSDMIGKTFTRVNSDGDRVVFENDEVRYTLYHEQDCCEHVYVEDIVGDLEDLENLPMLVAAEVSSEDEPPVSSGEESYTWTFYRFGTYRGFVTIRFYGSSNGYYSESVTCIKENVR